MADDVRYALFESIARVLPQVRLRAAWGVSSQIALSLSSKQSRLARRRQDLPRHRRRFLS
jgi:hypothetical protein